MFIGHVALGFAAKRVTPHVSLGVLFAACQLADLLWPVLVAVGVEQVLIEPGNTAFTPLDFVSYPYSHSLVMLAVWAVIFAAIGASTNTGPRAVTFLVLAALVVSHWLLDAVTHRPDMPLYPGGPKVGLGLWNSIPATLAIELAMYAAGLFLYLRATRARDAIGRWALVSFAAFLLLAYAGNLFGPPPSVSAIWVVGIAGGAILVAWCWWADRHRVAAAVAGEAPAATEV
jgi:membrane-bound metal-dependent hydrolase YbcI (DUF457 family)